MRVREYEDNAERQRAYRERASALLLEFRRRSAHIIEEALNLDRAEFEQCRTLTLCGLEPSSPIHAWLATAHGDFVAWRRLYRRSEWQQVEARRWALALELWSKVPPVAVQQSEGLRPPVAPDWREAIGAQVSIEAFCNL